MVTNLLRKLVGFLLQIINIKPKYYHTYLNNLGEKKNKSFKNQLIKINSTLTFVPKNAIHILKWKLPTGTNLKNVKRFCCRAIEKYFKK